MKVVIVDDSSIVRRLFEQWLGATEGITVVGAYQDGIEALQRLGSDRPDVIVLDLAMPELDGLAVLPLLAKLVPDARVLVVSGQSQKGSEASYRCLMRGAAQCLPKPSALDAGAPNFRAALVDLVLALGNRQDVLLDA